MLVRLRESYLLKAGPVTLDVDVGEGQRGYVEVQLNGRLIQSGPGISQLRLGDGSDLRGGRLRVTSTVTDTNPQTNRTNVTYRLSGGQRDTSYISSHEVDRPGGTVDYDAIFRLI